MKEHTGLLTAKKRKASEILPKSSFLIGLGSVLNLAGNYFDYKYSKTDMEADLNALKSDWQNVGDDLREAQARFDQDFCLK